MKDFCYIDDVVTLRVDRGLCVGCGQCCTVCPHRILTLAENKVQISALDSCIECGACMKNCPTDAISVSPGVGCADAIINSWLKKLTGRDVAGRCC